VHDPVHFAEPQKLPEIGSTEHDLLERHSGLQLLSQAHISMDAIIQNRETGTGIVGGPGSSLANTIIQHQKKGYLKLRFKGVLRPEYKCTLNISIRFVSLRNPLLISQDGLCKSQSLIMCPAV